MFSHSDFLTSSDDTTLRQVEKHMRASVLIKTFVRWKKHVFFYPVPNGTYFYVFLYLNVYI